jgi:hypothetical protein
MKIGELVDQLFVKRSRKEELEEELKGVKAEIEKLEYDCIQAMKDEGVDKTSTGSGSVTLKVEQYPSVTDLEALVDWAHANGMAGILQRRVSKTVFDEYFEDTGEYPDGVDTYVKEKLNFRRKNNG